MTEKKLPRTALDLLSLSAEERERIFSSIERKRRSGDWDYPVATNGDFAEMTLDDMIYWFHKASEPVRCAVRDSGLERFFAEQSPVRLPDGFTPLKILRLAAAGDLMDHEALARSASTLYPAIVPLLFDADVCTANLEAVVSDAHQSLTLSTTEAPPLIYGEGSFDVVSRFGARPFSFVSAACNHSLDGGVEGLRSTQAALDASGIAWHGTYRDEAASRRATIVEANGLKLAMVSHTFGLNGHRAPAGQEWLVSHTRLNATPRTADFAQLAAQIAHARAEGADFVIGHLHWGLEHEFYPRPEQLEVAHCLAELGLDVIIGHHPHVVQPVEYYRTARDQTRVVPIFYSLGNLVNPFSHPAFCLGGIAQLSLVGGVTRDGALRTYVASAEVAHVFQDYDAQQRVLRLMPANNEQRGLLPWMTSSS